MLWKTPPLLILSMKRFTTNMKKINHKIQVPETLDISPHILSNDSPTQYHLKAVAYHFGSYMGGHYVALCRNPNGQWNVFDDESVHLAQNVDLTQGYAYFYEALPIS